MSKVFLDTNILVYAQDQADPAKRSRARECLSQANTDMVISTQVLQEFYVTTVKKLHVPTPNAKSLVRSLEGLETVLIDRPLILEAIDCSAMDQLSFWDALIVCAARHANCETIWTEDLNDGQVIRGVQVVNPLKA